jgi:hypothetical protein
LEGSFVSKVGESSNEVILREGGGRLPARCKVVLSHYGDLLWGDEKGFLDFLTLVGERQRQEIPISASKPKGTRESKNLECSINFDARGVGYGCLVLFLMIFLYLPIKERERENKSLFHYSKTQNSG